MTVAAPDGLLLVDKPSGWTSHDVVAKVRHLARQRRVGHAGTLDPMATGLLVLGIGRATRLLGHLGSSDKDYAATVRLGESTVTDDADGEVVGGGSAAHLTRADVERVAATLTGDLMQRPSAVSAVKVDGRRSYARVRAGEDVTLPERPVHVARFEVGDLRPSTGADGRVVMDVDVLVTCTAGTYVRALARDLGAALEVGGHLTALRRTRSGGFSVADAATIEQLSAVADQPQGIGGCMVGLADAVASAFPRWDVEPADVARVRNGVRLAWAQGLPDAGPVGLFAPDGTVLALAERRDDTVAYLAVLG